MNWVTGSIIVGLLTISGLFSGSETALTAASKARLHALSKAARQPHVDHDDQRLHAHLQRGGPGELQDVTDRVALVNWCKALEDAHGRDRSEGSWKPRTLDLDLLMYDEEVLDDDLFRYPHVYVPASELIDLELPDPEQGVTLKVELSL